MKLLLIVALIALFSFTSAWQSKRCHKVRIAPFHKKITRKTYKNVKVAYKKYVKKTFKKTVCQKVKLSRRVKHWYKSNRRVCWNTNQRYLKTISFVKNHKKYIRKTKRVRRTKRVPVVKRTKHRQRYYTWKVTKYFVNQRFSCKKSKKVFYWHYYTQPYKTTCVVTRPKKVWRKRKRNVTVKYTDRVWTEKYQKVKKDCYKKVYIDVVKYKTVQKMKRVQVIENVKVRVKCTKRRRRKIRRFKYVIKPATCTRRIPKYRRKRITKYRTVIRKRVSYKQQKYWKTVSYIHVHRYKKRYIRKVWRTRSVKKCKNVPTRKYRYKTQYYYKILPRLITSTRRVPIVAYKWKRKPYTAKFLVPYYRYHTKCHTVTDTIQDKCLWRGHSIQSSNGIYKFIMQGDGNAVIYRSGRAIWSTRTHRKHGNKICMQTDGNLVVYNRHQKDVWSSHTFLNRRNVFRLIMQNDGNLVVYNRHWKPVWASKGGRKKYWRD